MIEETIPSAATNAAHSMSVVQVEIFAAQCMAALASWQRSFHFRVRCRCFFLRGFIVVLPFWRQDTLQRPSFGSPVPNRAHINAALFCKFCNMIEASLYFYRAFFSCVSSLLGQRGPLAIFWVIQAIRVFAFKRVPIRTRPHVIRKCLEGITPAVANRDAALAIILEAKRAWVIAACQHVPPCLVNHSSRFHASQYTPDLQGGEQ